MAPHLPCRVDRYCTPFAKDYGLSASFFRDLSLESDEAELFLHKLNLIYSASQEMCRERARRENA
jgi:hypothetical protein